MRGVALSRLRSDILCAAAPRAAGVQGLGDGTWGCNGLEQVVNTGSDLLLSPMRISSLPLSIGDMQRRYLTRRRAYNALTGPKRSRLGLSELKERPRRRYNNRMIALSPPLVLQSRYDPQNSGCEVRRAPARSLASRTRAHRPPERRALSSVTSKGANMNTG